MDIQLLHSFDSMVIAAVSVVIVMYMVAPLMIKANQRTPLNPSYLRYDPNQLSPEVAAFFSQSLQAFLARGFTVIDYVTKPGAAARVTPVIIYLVNRSTGDMATIAAIYTELLGPPTLKSFNVFCQRILTDGTRVLIANHVPQGAGSVYKKRPYAPGYSFDGPMDTGLLYDLFLFAVRKHADGKTPVIPAPGTEIDAFRAMDRDTHEYQVKCGLLRVDETAGVYEKTLYGAYYITWSLLWPIKQFKKQASRAKAARLMAEYRAQRERVTA